MSENTTTPRNLNNSPIEDDSIDVKKIVSTIINNWVLFIISIVLCVILSVVYAYYSAPGWHVSSKILVEDQKNSPASALGGTLTSDISSLFNVKSSADNEVQILKSRSLMADVVKQMQLNIRTYKVKGLKEVEVFEESPFNIHIKYKVDTLIKRAYKIVAVDDNNYQLTNSDDNVNIKAKYGATIQLRQYALVIDKVTLKPIRDTYAVTVEEEDQEADDLSKIFSVALSDKQSTTIDLSFSYPHPKKAEAILNTLMQIYLRNNLKNKKLVADSTMAFIDARIKIVNSELSGVEQGFQDYKQENNIADIAEQSKALVTTGSDFLKKLNEQQVQLSVVNDLQKFINDKKLVPSSLIIPEAMAFGQSINAYNELLISRDKAALSVTPNNPVYKNITQQIESAREGLIGSVESYKKSLVAGIDQLKKQNSVFTGQLKEVPKKERLYLDFARKQQLQQELYLYLLQKKEETAISKTSTISSSRIIDYAKSEFRPYKPVKIIIYLVGLLFGVVIPGIYLFIKELLNIRVNTKGDIEKMTTVPVIGEISHNDEEKNLVVVENSRTIISEQFRSLRTNLQYALDSSKPNVLLFTSSMSGEGKSFISLNLGSALALTDKKVVFIELDLRKPKLSENIGLDNSDGFTNFIVSKSTDYTKILKPVWFNKNCQLISSGPIPPNPAELLVSNKLGDLINDLKKEFDYIIIDCAPIGLVADALLLEKYADVTFYVVRQGYTYKSQLNIVNDLKSNKGVDNLYMLINDIKSKNGAYSSYGQGYGYGYGYGYGGYAEETKKKKK